MAITANEALPPSAANTLCGCEVMTGAAPCATCGLRFKMASKVARRRNHFVFIAVLSSGCDRVSERRPFLGLLTPSLAKGARKMIGGLFLRRSFELHRTSFGLPQSPIGRATLDGRTPRLGPSTIRRQPEPSRIRRPHGRPTHSAHVPRCASSAKAPAVPSLRRSGRANR